MLKPIQILKIIIKIVLILPIIKHGVQSVIQAYKAQNDQDDLI